MKNQEQEVGKTLTAEKIMEIQAKSIQTSKTF